VKILANPVFLRAGVVFCCAAFSFLLGLIFIRLLRKNITEEAEISSEASPSLETLPMHLYNTVIQQLKQQKHELQVQSQTEQARARTAETFSQAVLSNLSSGVLVLGTNGLVKSTNAAAKAILGFASTTGMSAADIFRGAEIRSSASDPLYVGDEIAAVLHEGSNRRQVEAALLFDVAEQLQYARRIAAQQVEHETFEVGRLRDVHARAAGVIRLGSLAHTVDARAEELIEHIVLVGRDDELLDRQPHHPRDMACADVAKIAGRHRERHALVV